MKISGYSGLYLLLIFLIIFSLPVFTPAKPIEGSDSDILTLKHRPASVKPAMQRVSPEADILRVIVKFNESTGVRLRNNKLVSNKGLSLKAVNDIIKPYTDGRLSRLLPVPEEKLAKSKSIYEAKSGHQLADFNLYYKIDVSSASEVESLVNRLNKLDIVEIAYPEPEAEPAGDIYPPTPDYDTLQKYRNPAPVGVDAIYANSQPGGDGSGVKIIDIENSWNDTHEDLDAALGGTINGGADQYGNHGTAVLGEMIGGDNGYGVTGICPGASIGMASAAINGTVEAMWLAIDTLEAGDLMLIELHAPGPRYNFQVRTDQLGYVCMEYWQDRFDALQYAWAKGIIVIEAAGNGAEDFDDEIYEQKFDTTYRNSHAIIAGAGAPPSGNYGTPRSRLGFSNYGERVNLQGYGREVFTTGYGDYWDGDSNDPNQYYTATFSGTSSASPIVTGTVACLQGYYENSFGVPLTSDQALQYLNSTGTSQGGDTTQHIGPLPNLAAAMASVMPPPTLSTSPIYFDTSLEKGTSAEMDLWLFNGSYSNNLDFAITDNDSLLKIADWLSISPTSGSVLQSDSLLLTVTLDASGLEDQIDTYKGIIKIAWNVTGESPDSTTLVPVFLEVPCLNDTTFVVSKSTDPEGPEFNWIEIHDIGTMIPRESYYNSYSGVPLDDGTAGPIALPFAFPFYGANYNQLYVGVNGAISFTETEVNSGGYFGNFKIPGNPFNTFVAIYWNDLLLEDFLGFPLGNIYYYHAPTNDTTVIEWYHAGNYNSPFDTATTFEVVFTADGNIIFQYLNVGESGLENTALIGISATGCTAEPFVDHGDPAENVVTDSSTVLFERNVILVMAGDCNNDGTINIFDITHLIGYLYLEGDPPDPMASGDVNCDETINIFDITDLIAYLYLSGAPPCYYVP